MLECNVWCSSQEVERRNESLGLEETPDVWCSACIDLRCIVAVKSSGSTNGFVPDDMATVYFAGGDRFTTDVPYATVKEQWIKVKEPAKQVNVALT